MKEDDVSSHNTKMNNNSANSCDRLRHARSSSPTPAVSSVGASSPAVPVNAGSVDWSGHGEGSSKLSCRPWDRGDLLRRLATFRPVNWHGKPKAACALACAQRGWVNVDVDQIQCESCSASLQYISSSSLTNSEADRAVEEFAKQLDEGHKNCCPWRGNCCQESLVQFPPTPPSALIGGYKDRCDGLLQFHSLPVVSAFAIAQMRASRGPQIDRLLSQSQFIVPGDFSHKIENANGLDMLREDTFTNYSRAQKLISLCGWEPRWLPNIQDCEEHSAQSTRNGRPAGPTVGNTHLQDLGPNRKAASTSSKKFSGNCDAVGLDFKCESRSPLLDCSLCGVTVRIWDFLTVSRPARFAPNNVDIPETSKKIGLTRGVSAASGINGWVANDDLEQEHNDEAATTDKRRPISNNDLNQTVVSSSPQVNRVVMPENYQASDAGRDLVMRQPAGSEVGDRAASFESRGPSTRKRSLDEGGSTVDRPYMRVQQVDSIDGTVLDRDGDEVDDNKRYSAGPSKRARDSDIYPSSFRRDSSSAGPSNSVDIEIERDANRYDPFSGGNEQALALPPTRDSTHVSSVIAMDTICHGSDDDSMESVENCPVDAGDVNFPSAATAQSPDVNDPSCSNQAQQSACFQPLPFRPSGEAGVSSINDGEEVLNAETVTAHGKDGLSIGVSGGSVGMGGSQEAEIHGTDISVHRGDSVVGDMEPVAEVVENQGQTGEFASGNGLTDDFVPEEMDREDPHGDSQDMVSQSVGRADSGSKVIGSLKAESVESGDKGNMRMLLRENSAHLSLSCNAIMCSGCEVSKEEVTQAGKASSPIIDVAYPASGPPNLEVDDEAVVEFDPIKHHNCYCPWVNENVAAAGCSSGSSSSSGLMEAVCGWQLTLDALDTFQSSENIQIQTMESESAASLCKDDRRTPPQKLIGRRSLVRSRGQK